MYRKATPAYVQKRTMSVGQTFLRTPTEPLATPHPTHARQY